MITTEENLSDVLLMNEGKLVVSSSRYLDQISPNIDVSKVFLVKNADLSEAQAIVRSIQRCKTNKVLAFGSGKVIDTAKYSSAVTGAYFVAVPTCLSTNCHFTDKSTLFDKGSKHTLNSKIPEKVIFDWPLISKNRFMNGCGVIELLSSCSALIDWQIAKDNQKETMSDEIYSRAKDVAVEAEKILMVTGEDRLRTQSELLRKSGDIAVEYGCGRPVSGSEHILSSLIENYYRCPHGVALSITIPVAIRLQKSLNYPEVCPGLGEKLAKNNPFRKFIVETMNRKVLTELLSNVKPRLDRFTVIDKIEKQEIESISKSTLNDIFD